MHIQHDVINTFLADWNNYLNEVMITVPRVCNNSLQRLKKHRILYLLCIVPCLQSFKIPISAQLRRCYSETDFFRTVEAFWRLLTVKGFNSMVLCNRISGYCQSSLNALSFLAKWNMCFPQNNTPTHLCLYP